MTAWSRDLHCGAFERGFARVRCPACAANYLLAFSWKGRGICPSCGAKCAAEIAGFLKAEVVAKVGHCQRVSTVLKPPRPRYKVTRLLQQADLFDEDRPRLLL